MPASLRFCGLSALLLSGVVGILLCRPQWLEDLGVEVGSEAEWTDSGSEPDPRSAIATARSKAKGQVTARLLAGDVSLFEAAAWFRDINAEPAEFPDTGHLRQPGNSEEEKLCRQVIDWAKSRKGEAEVKGDVERLVTRLQAELDSQLRHNGQIKLPDCC